MLFVTDASGSCSSLCFSAEADVTVSCSSFNFFKVSAEKLKV